MLYIILKRLPSRQNVTWFTGLNTPHTKPKPKAQNHSVAGGRISLHLGEWLIGTLELQNAICRVRRVCSYLLTPLIRINPKFCANDDFSSRKVYFNIHIVGVLSFFPLASCRPTYSWCPQSRPSSPQPESSWILSFLSLSLRKIH